VWRYLVQRERDKGTPMSSWLIAIIGLVYFYIAVEQTLKGNIWMGITYLGYAVGNIGLYKLAT
jgi:hypothetical protein